MKCQTCAHWHFILPCNDAPYGEVACLLHDQDLWDCNPEDVADCNDHDPIQYPEEG